MIVKFKPKTKNALAEARMITGKTRIQSAAITENKTNKNEDKMIKAEIKMSE